MIAHQVYRKGLSRLVSRYLGLDRTSVGGK